MIRYSFYLHIAVLLLTFNIRCFMKTFLKGAVVLFLTLNYPIFRQVSTASDVKWIMDLPETRISADTLQQKSNIHTSRSNIKKSQKPSDIGVNEPGVNLKEPPKGGGAIPAGNEAVKNKKKDKENKK